MEIKKLDDFTVSISGSTTASAAQLDELVRELGKVRQDLQPAVQAERPNGDLHCMGDPAYKIETQVNTGLTVFSIRDPRYGWLHYAISPLERLRIAEILVQHHRVVTEAQASPAAGNNNPISGGGGPVLH